MNTATKNKPSNSELLDDFLPEPASDPVHRKAVINAVTRNFHTLTQICKTSELPTDVVLFELKALEGIEISSKPGPPVTTYWLKGKVPEGRIYLSGGKVGVVAPASPVDFKNLINEKNQELKKNSVPTITVVPKVEPLAVNEPVKTEEIKNENTEPNKQALINNHMPKGEIYINLPISIVLLHPENPRDFINTVDEAFIELTNSIREKGVQEPLIVTANADGKTYRVVMGNRRRLASEAAGKSEVPCIIRKYASMDEEIEVMLIENIQRQDLTPSQEAKAFERLLKQSKDIHAVARRVGLTQSYIASRLTLLKLDPLIQRMIDTGELQTTAGAVLAALPVEKQRLLITRAPRMNIDKLREAVKRVKEGISFEQNPQQKARKRVTTDEEKFTRSGALKSLNGLGEAWFSSKIVIDAFDDTCMDSCLESKDETLCHSCPVPRLIASITRRISKETL